MKEVLLLFNFYLFSQLLLSCSQEIIREDNNSTSFIVTKAVPREHISYYVNEEGALCFETGNDFLLLTNYLSALSSEEFKNWEMSIGFKSYRTVTDEILFALYSKENTSEYNQLLERYKSFVYLDPDSIATPIIQGLVYRNISNKDGIFYIQETKNKFNGNTLTFYDAQNKQLPIRHPLTKANGDVLVQYPTKSYTPDNKKRVDTSAKIYEVVASNGFNTYSQLYMDIVVSGYKKNVFGKWKRYNTTCQIDDVTVRIPGFDSDIIYAGTYSSNECSTYTHSFLMVPSQPQLHLPQPPYQLPLCLHYRARTRGTGNMGMAYNFFHGTFFDVSHVTPNNPGCDKHILVTYNK